MKRAFSFIELIVVIILVSILIYIFAPRQNLNNAKLAAQQIVSHIRYARHLAIQDDKFDLKTGGKNWRKSVWSVSFNNTTISNCGGKSKTWRYSVYSNRQKDQKSELNSPYEVARNPSRSDRYLSPGWSGISKKECGFVSDELNLGSKFNIVNVSFGKSCGAEKRLSFDRFGRLVSNKTKNRIKKENCIISITENNGNTAKIIVYAKSGFAQICDQANIDCIVKK
ncbi:pilus assembly FimT family protein [Campylobacter mucosalis]|uniref:pilus assembly FimT family protein n=1 Tax=Campylobacter mucosalis TaxID=202 RepID=UPI00147044FF|nr:type II secretion system protein [Campylobacter mucosalis]